MKKNNPKQKSINSKEIKGLRGIWRLENHQESIHKFIDNNFVNIEGRVVIHVQVSSNECVFNPLPITDRPLLSNDVREYIEERADPVPIKYPLSIHFHGIDDIDIRNKIYEAYYTYYKFQLQEKKQDERIALGKTIVFCLIGAGALSLSLSLGNIPGQMINQILSVISAFSMWEAANDFLIERNKKRAEFFDAGQLASAELHFE